MLSIIVFIKVLLSTISNGNLNERSAVWSEIIGVISKSDERTAHETETEMMRHRAKIVRFKTKMMRFRT